MSERRDVWWFFDIDDVLYDATLLKRLARENAVVAMIEAGLPVDFDTLLRSVNDAVEKFGEDYPRHFDEALGLIEINIQERSRRSQEMIQKARQLENIDKAFLREAVEEFVHSAPETGRIESFLEAI